MGFVVEKAYWNECEYIGMIDHGESVLYIEKVWTVCNGGKPYNVRLVASTACNTMNIPHHKMKYDEVFSLDENLQAFVEKIELETP